ncbi:MAG: redoxin domain-containing protein, partial [Spirochaetales bacterium]|nr:redoxin domain-containing protein [Spirochaetales bacterium]
MINLKKFSLTLLVIFCVAFGVFAGDKTDIVGDGVKWFNSKPMNAKDFKGKVVFVEVFKTWQVSTDNTAAFLNLINETLKSPNFIVMGLSSEQPAEVKKYIVEYKITYPVACGKNSLTSYKVDIPAMFLIVDGEIHSFDPTKKYKFNY